MPPSKSRKFGIELLRILFARHMVIAYGVIAGLLLFGRDIVDSAVRLIHGDCP